MLKMFRHPKAILLSIITIIAAAVFFSTNTMALTFDLTNEGYSIDGGESAYSFNSAKMIGSNYMGIMVGPYVYIYDVSTPSSPSFVSQILLPSDARDVAYSALGYLLVADGPAGMLIYDFSTPSNPVLKGVFRRDDANTVAVSGTGKFAYVSPGTNSFYVVKITNPENPKLQRTKSFNNAVIHQLLVPQSSGKTLLVAAGPKGVLSYSIQHPRDPDYLGRVKSLESVTRISENNRVVAAVDSSEGLVMIHYPQWKNPVVKGSLNLTPNILDCVLLQGGLTALVAQEEGGISVIDTTDSNNPVLVAQDTSPVNARFVCADGAGTDGFVLCGYDGFWSADVSTPSSPVVSQIATGLPSFNAVASTGNTAFVAVGDDLRIYDFGSSSSNTITPPSKPTYLTVDENLLFVSCNNSSLAIYDISSPLSPSLLSTTTLDSNPDQVSVQGTLVAVACGSGGIAVLDITDPSSPSVLSTIDEAPNLIYGVAVTSDDILWTAGTAALKSFDLSDPTNPEELNATQGISYFGHLMIQDNFLYLAGQEGGFKVFRIIDPENPKKLDDTNTGFPYDFSANGTTMLLSNGAFGIIEYDITDPKMPAPTRQFEAPGFVTSAVMLDNGTVVIAAKNGGLWALSHSDCAGTNLLLPCDTDWISPTVAPLFTWIPRTDAKYKVKISQDPTFPSKKTFTGLVGGKAFDTPYWRPGNSAWKTIRHKGRGQTTLYWRVVFMEDSGDTFSETREFTVY